jgi:phytoene/squalene synthetase
MAQLSSVELDHCRELALLPGSVFEFTSRYVSKDKLDPLLAVYALNQAIGSIPLDHVDDEVKWAKLKWWSEEITAPPDAPSRHPVLRALWQSGARTNLGNTLLLRLVGDALSQVDAAPDPDESAMFERQSDLGSSGIELELALNNAEISSRSMKYLGAATRVFRLISSFSVNYRSDTTQLPLNILAKHNVNAEQLETESHTAELTQIVVQLTQNALDWYSKGTSDLKMKPEPSACTHLQLRWAMEKRCLTAIRKNPEKFLKAGKRFGPADAWFAWRFLRKLA